jgi:hypothetical protein
MEGPPDNRTAEHRRPHLLRQHGFTYSQNLPAGSIFSHPPPSNPLSPYPTPWNGQILQNMESFQVFRPQVWSSASISNVACTSSNNMSHIPQPYMPQPSNSTIGPQTLDLGLQSIHMAADNLEHLELLLEPQGPEERTERLAPRQSALNLPEWEEHRAEIKRLYIDESNSLDKTREIIYKEFGFESS